MEIRGRPPRAVPLARRVVSFVSKPPVLATLAGLCFLAISYWWLRVDGRGPDNDASRHIGYAWTYFEDMRAGEYWTWFTAFDPGFAYPPLVHLIGALSLLPGSKLDLETPIFTMNVVFVPMLVAGAYGLGSIAGDRRTGLLAVLVALGTPMIMSMFHAFMTDGALAATVALTAWLILRSGRFASWPWSAAAGAAAGLGLMTKSPFVFFVAGLIAMVLLRGGWRNWRGMLAFAVVALAIALPWHVEHYHDITSHTEAVTALENPPPQVSDSEYPDRWTMRNFTWYAWNGLNNQVYVPLALLFLFGLGYSTWRLAKGWRARGVRAGPPSTDITPELLAGLAGGYLGISYLGLDDPRYTLPCLVYFAVFATSWMAHVSRRVFTAGAVAVLAIVALNTATVSFGWGPNVGRLTLFSSETDSQIRRGEVTIDGKGYVSGPPDKGADLPSIFTGANAEGVLYVTLGHPPKPTLFFGAGNMMYVAREASLAQGGHSDELGPEDMYMYMTLEPEPGSCTRSEVQGFYFNLRRGDERERPWQDYPPYCPLD